MRNKLTRTLNAKLVLRDALIAIRPMLASYIRHLAPLYLINLEPLKEHVYVLREIKWISECFRMS